MALGEAAGLAGDGGGFSAGVSAAIEAAGPALPLRDAEQLVLMAEEAGADRVQAVHVGLAHRGRGRPRGALNKRSGAIRDWLLSTYAHPLETLAQVQSRPVDALAAELGCTKLEAAALQVKAAVELAPYLEGKQPVTIDLNKRSDVIMVMSAPGAAQELAQRIGETDLDGIDWDQATIEGMAENRQFLDASDDELER